MLRLGGNVSLKPAKKSEAETKAKLAADRQRKADAEAAKRFAEAKTEADTAKLAADASRKADEAAKQAINEAAQRKTHKTSIGQLFVNDDDPVKQLNP
jgi:membrane protein involved in colicin uptake